jgi:hypothetical protein
VAANNFAPTGLSFVRNFISGSNTFQQNQSAIKVGYPTAIGLGDLVKLGTGTYQGYTVLSLLTDTNTLGVFGGVLAYVDATLQGVSHGLNGSYQPTANPIADIPCLDVMDPYGTFKAQVLGGTFAQTWVGQNITFVAGSNGAPNASGRSTLALDYTTLGTSNTLPFRVVGVLGVTGGPQDPAIVNPWIEVRLNTSSVLNPTGI